MKLRLVGHGLIDLYRGWSGLRRFFILLTYLIHYSARVSFFDAQPAKEHHS
jgi:hypothetical protein